MLVGSGVIFARMLGPEDRGYLALLSLWPAILWQLGSLGIQVSASYFIARQPSSAHGVSRLLLKFGLIQCACLVVIHALVLLWFLRGRSPYLVVPALISLGIVPPSLLRQYALGVLQGQRRFGEFNVGRFLPSAFTTIGAVGLWITNTRGLTAASAVLLVSTAVSAAITLATIRDLLGGKVDLGQRLPSIREMIKFGLKSLPSSAYPVESFRLDQLFASLALSPAALGIYVVASSFTNLPRFAAQSIGMVSYPNIAALAAPDQRHKALWHFFWVTTAVVTPIVVVLVLIVPWLVPFFFGNEFAGAIPISQVLIAAGLFLGLRRSWFDGLRGAGFPLVGTVSEAISWVVLVPAMFVLGATFGVVGVSIAVLLSSLFSFSLVVIAEIGLRRRGTWRPLAPSPVAVREEPLPLE